MKVALTVEGMHCNSCKMLIEDELADLGAEDVVVTFDPKTQVGKVACEAPDREAIVVAIEGLGKYKVKS